jgi:molybdopterin molybdotransferase
MLTALAARDGAEVLPVQYVADDYIAVRDAIHAATANADVILVSGGTSVGMEDHAPRAAAELGELAVHGVAIKPAGPLGVAFLPRPLFLIPGNPVACLCAYDLFAGRVVRRLGGRSWELPYRMARLPLAGKIASAVGRVDYVRVKIEGGEVRPLATGGASNLSTAVAADGFVLVPRDLAALAPGDQVDVWFYDA